MWNPLPPIQPQLSGSNWIKSSQIILPQVDYLLVKVDFFAQSFTSIFSGVWVRIRQSDLAYPPQRFWVDPQSQIWSFPLAKELPKEVEFESKILKRYRGSEPLFSMAISYWGTQP